LISAVTEREPHGDGWYQTADAENQAVPSAPGQEKRTAGYAEEQTIYRTCERS
jgi:hypothetical protein